MQLFLTIEAILRSKKLIEKYQTDECIPEMSHFYRKYLANV